MSKSNPKERKLNIYFNYFSEKSPTSISRILQSICAFGIFFGILGLCWSLPFPYLQFLGKYNGYFNWASFFIALSIFYYVRLSPILSYLMLFLTLFFTYLITLIGNRQLSGNWINGQVYFFIIFACGILRYFTYKMTGKNSTMKMEFLFVLIGPVWTLHFLLKKMNVKYQN